MKKRVIIILIGIGMILLVSCVKKKTSEAEVPEFVFSYAENQAEDYPTTLGAYHFAELIQERTHGRIKIMVQAKGTLGYEKEVIEQIRYGGIDFARVSLSEISEWIPKFSVLQMPYLYKNSEHMWKVLDSEIGDDFLEATKGFHMIGLSWYDAGARNFYNSVHPITRLEDLEGLRIRVQESDLMADIVEALGAKAVPGVYDEVYSNLEKGTIDGAENNWPSYESMGHYEVAKYYTVDEHTRVPEIQICSEATWNKLSVEDQAIIKECAKESALYERELWKQREKASQIIAVQKGTQVTMLSPSEKARFQEAVSGIYEKYCGAYMTLINQIIEMAD